MFFLELTTGLRKGELVALLWEDVDEEQMTISISKQAYRTNGELKVLPPKTDNSVRKIAISQETLKLLQEEHRKHPSNPYLFPSPVPLFQKRNSLQEVQTWTTNECSPCILPTV